MSFKKNLSSVQLLSRVSLRPHELQHARHPCPSPTPGVCSNSCPLSQWCHPTLSSSVTLFSSCPQSFPASESFQVSQLFTTGDQGIGVSTSASVLPVNIQGWFPLGLIGLITLLSKGLSRVLSRSTVWKHHSSVLSLLHGPTLKAIHDYWKNHSFDYMAFVSKVMSLLFNTLSKFVIAFLPRSKHLLISWLQILSAEIFGAQENKSLSLFPLFPHLS